jgi:hypothetical protein
LHLVLLQELKELRAGGVRNLEEAEEFEILKRKRAAENGPSKAMDRSQRYTARTGTDDSSVMSQVCSHPLLLQNAFAQRNTTMKETRSRLRVYAVPNHVIHEGRVDVVTSNSEFLQAIMASLGTS